MVNKKTRNPIFISENLEHFGEIRFKRRLQKMERQKDELLFRRAFYRERLRRHGGW